MEYKIKYGVEIDITQLEPNPWNVNKTTPRQQEANAQSAPFGRPLSHYPNMGR